MFIDVFKNNGIEYLRLAESRRITNAKGKKATSKKIILNLGPLSRFDDGKPEYRKRLRQSFKDGNPLISELMEYANSSVAPEKYTIKAHLILCFMALTMLRVLQLKIQKSLPESDKDCYWSYGINGEKITDMLYNWKVDMLPGNYYRMLHPDFLEFNKVISAFGVSLDHKLFSFSDIIAIKSSVKIF